MPYKNKKLDFVIKIIIICNYNRFIEFLDKGEEKGFFPIQAPLVHVSFMDGRWRAMFTNGRHRYSVFRDMEQRLYQ